MAEGWMTVRVSLLGGRDIVCDPPPGRVILLGPSDSFADLAEAIDAAFGRWDLSHLHMFELADGRHVSGDVEDWDDEIEDEAELTVASEVGVGDHFLYVFDLGDDWRHDCEVVEKDIDVLATYGEIPPSPIPIWGWGSIPDQYGRQTENDGSEDEPAD